MATPLDRPAMTAPPEIGGLLARVQEQLDPVEIWLFGSRARRDNRPDSDWDLVAVLPDDAADELMDPLVAWSIARSHPEPLTLLCARRSDLASVWGLPNTLGYDLARDGVRLLVG